MIRFMFAAGIGHPSRLHDPARLLSKQCRVTVLFLLLSLIVSLRFSPVFARQFLAASPSGKLSVTLSEDSGRISMRICFADRKVLDVGPLGLVLTGNDTLDRFRIKSYDSGCYTENYSMPWGTSSCIRNCYRESVLDGISYTDSFPLKFVVRVYDDGFAFRYESDFSGDSLRILGENGTFRLSGANRCWWSWADYNTLEKEIYSTTIGEAAHVALPFTVELDSSTYLSILEAAIDDYTTMTLKQEPSDSLAFRTNLVPWSDGVAVKLADKLRSPWRTFILAEDPAGLLSTDIVYNLNEPARGDYSWVKPMKYIGVWWEMHLGLSTWKKEGGRHGATTARVNDHILFAAANGIQGVLAEGWNTGWERWGEKGAFDFTTAYDDFDLKKLSASADFRNISIIGHHETGGDIIAYEERLDSAFSLYRRLGIRYVKTGYAGPVNPPQEHHHGQYMVRHMNKVMRKAADYRIALDVHEPVIPSGFSRTYPNLMTFEGVRGMEWNAWSEGNPPSHTCMMPFTRGLAGPMDYTPGIFDIREDRYAEKRVSWNALDKGKNAVHSTLSNQLALMVINYSPLQMAADLPENYSGHPALRFITEMPVAWDETRILGASVGEFIVVARRRGTTWYVAGITNEYSRTFSLPTDFLKSGKSYAVNACTDAAGSHYENNPEAYSIRQGNFKRGGEFDMWMAPGGGELIVFSEQP